jgi:hypothetical protein
MTEEERYKAVAACRWVDGEFSLHAPASPIEFANFAIEVVKDAPYTSLSLSLSLSLSVLREDDLRVVCRCLESN